MAIALGLNVQPVDDLRLAQAPIFASELVDAIEWTWEGTPPPWLNELATFFAGHAALYALMLYVPAVALLREYGGTRAFAPFGIPLFAERAQEISWMLIPADARISATSSDWL